MTRDELIAKLLTFDNLEVKLNLERLSYDILNEDDVFEFDNSIIIQRD